MKILVVNVNWLGDVLLSTAALRALRKHYPTARLACLVPPRCRDVLQGNPYIDEIIPDEGFWKTFWRVKKSGFDSAIFFHRSGSRKFLAFLAGIPARLGFQSTPRRNFFLTRTFTPPPDGTHRGDFFLELLSAMGVASDGRAPDFFPSGEGAGELRKLLSAEGLQPSSPYAVMHPGGNWDLKRWPPRHFAEFAGLFLKAYPSMTLILCGTPPEKEIADEVLRQTASPRLISLCGKTTLDILAHLLKGARFLISNDSGPIHLAASQKTPIVGIFGPTSAALTGPVSSGPVLILSKDVGCQVPCYFKSCEGHQCMEWLAPEEVFRKTQLWLK